MSTLSISVAAVAISSFVSAEETEKKPIEGKQMQNEIPKSKKKYTSLRVKY